MVSRFPGSPATGNVHLQSFAPHIPADAFVVANRISLASIDEFKTGVFAWVRRIVGNGQDVLEQVFFDGERYAAA